VAVTDQQKIDFLLKKIGFTKTKTGSVVGTGAISGTPKQPFAEAIPSPLIIANDSLWNESASIPATAPTSDTAQVKVYLAGTSGHRMTADPTSSGQRAYIAHSTYNNTSSARLNNWIDTQFGSSYLIKVFKGDPNSGGVQLSAAGSGNNDGWFFDYSAGILNFNDTNVPSGVTDTNIYIVGYRYIGLTGAPTPTGAGNFTFNNLTVTGDIDVDGHTNLDNVSVAGITTFSATSNTLNVNTTTTNSAINIQLSGNTKGSIIPANDGLEIGVLAGNNLSMHLNRLGSNTSDFIVKSSGSELLKVNGDGGVVVTGILTATSFSGPLTGNVTGDVSGNAGTATALQTARNIGGVSFDGTQDIDLPGVNIAGNQDTSGNSATTTALQTARNIGGVSFDGTADINLPGVNIAGNQDTSGNAGTATALQNARTIGGVSFDGTANIDLPGVNIAGNQDTSGNSATATALQNARTIGGVSFDGTSNIDLPGVNIAGNQNTSGNAATATALQNARTIGGVSFDGTSNIDLPGVNIAGNQDTSGTAAGLSGSPSINITNLTAVDGTFSGNVSIGGTLTYEDVTNIDSVGLVTARSGIFLPDTQKAQFGNVAGSADLEIYHDGNHSYIHDGGTGNLKARTNNFRVSNGDESKLYATFTPTAVELYYNNIKRLETTGIGIAVNGKTDTTLLDVNERANIYDMEVSGISTFLGNVDINVDLDVDGHTNLDNVSIAGVTTITSSADAALYVDGRTVLGNDTLLPSFGAGTLAVVSNLSGNGNWVDLSILGGRTGRSILKFGDHDDQDAGAIKYYHTDDSLNFFTNGSTTEKLIIKSTGNVEITNDLDVDGHTNLDNVSVAGVTTFASNVSVGSSIAVGTGVTIESSGQATFTGIVTASSFRGDGSQLSGISVDASALKDSNGNVKIQANESGAVHVGISTFQDIDVDGHTNLDNVSVSGISTFSDTVHIPEDAFLRFGGNLPASKLSVGYSYGSNVLTLGASLFVSDTSTNNRFILNSNGNLEFCDTSGTTKLEVNNSGINVTGVSTFSGLIDANGDLDVDGHTTLNSLRVSGITTLADNIFLGHGADNDHINISAKFVSGIQPLHNFTYDIGDNVKRWKRVYAGTFIGNANVGILTSTSIDLDGDLDVDGHTNLDNVSIAGVVTATTFVGDGDFVDLDVDGHTNLDNVSIAGVSTFSDDVTFVGAAGTDATWVKDRNALSLEKYAKIEFGDFIGNDRKFRIFDEGTSKILSSNVLTIQSTLSDVRLTASLGDITLSSDNVILKPLVGGNVLKTSDTTAFLYYSGSEKLKTTSTGVFVTGILTTTDLDVDGHTNLDNVSVTGVTTFTGAAEFDSDVRFDSTITAGGGTGNNGQYLKSTGHGVAWESFPTMRTTTTVTASAGQTTFSFTYNVGFLDVFINGTKLTDSEFTATNGSSVVLAVGCFVGDIVELVSYNTVSGGGGSGAGSITVQDEGSSLSTGAETLNFVGTGVVASGTGPTKTITINTGTADTSNVTTNNLNVVGFSTFARSLLMKENQRINFRDANTAIYHQTNFNIESAGSGGDIILKTNAAGGNSNDVVLHGGSVGELLRAHGTGDVDITNTLGIGGSITKASGHLDIRASNLSLKNANNSATYASFTDGGSAELNHNNTKRLETLSNGVNVIGSLFVNGSAIGGGGGGSGFFSQTVSGIHTLSNVGIGTADPEFDLDLGSYTSQNVSTASTIRIMGDGASSTNTAIRFGAGGNNVDYTLLRVDGQDGTTDGDGNTDLGFALRYMSAGETGTDNRLAFWADNTTKTKYEALSIYNDGRVLVDNGAGGGHGFYGHPDDHFTVRGSSGFDNIRVVGVSTFQNVLPQTDSTYDIGTNTVRFRNIYADNLYGDGSNLTGISGGGGSNVGITTNLSGNFTATPGSPSTINTLSGYSSDDLVIEYTIYIKNGSNIQTQKLLAMRDGTTIDSTQFAVMFSSSLLAQFDATISSGDILLRATPESGITGNTTYKIKREVM